MDMRQEKRKWIALSKPGTVSHVMDRLRKIKKGNGLASVDRDKIKQKEMDWPQ